MNFGACWLLVVGVAVCGGERWRWPDGEAAPSVRIDTKVRFLDAPTVDRKDKSHGDFRVQSDEVPFKEPTETEGFYNRPPGAGRYPVRVEPHRALHNVERQSSSYAVHEPNNFDSDGTLDSLQYCKCVSTPDCNPRGDSTRACGSGKFLCCYERGNKVIPQKSEFFNEVDDERFTLLPGQPNIARPFPPPPNTGTNNGLFAPGQEVEILGGYDGPSGVIGPQGPAGNNGNRNPDVLVGPNGPSGIIGPGQQKQGILVGPDGPTGQIGPTNNNKGVLVGPDGPRDVGQSESAQRRVLVGPGGPTGIIGPYGQRPTLVGPGGPTGIIGPNRFQRPGLLVGPGGPSGIIGPGYGRQAGPGILVGPGGPTGIIGPGRQILVGPGGPTGQIGPPQRGYFGCSRKRKKMVQHLQPVHGH